MHAKSFVSFSWYLANAQNEQGVVHEKRHYSNKFYQNEINFDETIAILSDCKIM